MLRGVAKRTGGWGEWQLLYNVHAAPRFITAASHSVSTWVCDRTKHDTAVGWV